MPDSSHYYLGKAEVYHKNKLTSVAAGTRGFDISSEDLETRFKYEIAYVIAGYEHRPDLISNVFYHTPEYWWLILWYNNIDDPFEGLNIGDQNKIPNK